MPVPKCIRHIIHLARMRALFQLRRNHDRASLGQILETESPYMTRWMFCPLNTLEAFAGGTRLAELTATHSKDARHLAVAHNILRLPPVQLHEKRIIAKHPKPAPTSSNPAHIHDGVNAYTDGSLRHGRAGCGVHFPDYPHLDLSFALDHNDVHTISRAEIAAPIAALHFAPTNGPIQIISDSQMFVDGFRKYRGRRPKWTA